MSGLEVFFGFWVSLFIFETERERFHESWIDERFFRHACTKYFLSTVIELYNLDGLSRRINNTIL